MGNSYGLPVSSGLYPPITDKQNTDSNTGPGMNIHSIFEIDKPNPCVHITFGDNIYANAAGNGNLTLSPAYPDTLTFADVYINDQLYLKEKRFSHSQSLASNNVSANPAFFYEVTVIPTPTRITKVTLKNFKTDLDIVANDVSSEIIIYFKIVPVPSGYDGYASDLLADANYLNNTSAALPGMFYPASTPNEIRFGLTFDSQIYYLNHVLKPTPLKQEYFLGRSTPELRYYKVNVMDTATTFVTPMMIFTFKHFADGVTADIPTEDIPPIPSIIYKSYFSSLITQDATPNAVPYTDSNYGYYDQYFRFIRKPRTNETLPSANFQKFRWVVTNEEFYEQKILTEPGKIVKIADYIQGWWSDPNTPASATIFNEHGKPETEAFRFDQQNIYIDSLVADGMYDFYIITEMGHTKLNVIVSANTGGSSGSALTLSYLMFKNTPMMIASTGNEDIVLKTTIREDPTTTGYNLIDSVNVTTEHVYGYNKPSTAELGDVAILKSNHSVKFTEGLFEFEVTIVEVPTLKKLEVRKNSEYVIRDLLELDPRIPLNQVDIYGSNLPNSFGPDSLFSNHTDITSLVDGKITFTNDQYEVRIYNVPLFQLTCVEINIDTKTIFEKQNRLIDLRDYIFMKDDSGNEVSANIQDITNITDVTGTSNNGIRIQNGKIIFTKSNVTKVLAQVTIKGIIIDVTFNTFVIQNDSYRYYDSIGSILYLPVYINTPVITPGDTHDPSEQPGSGVIRVHDSQNSLYTLKTSDHSTIKNYSSFSALWDGSQWQITIQEEILIFVESYVSSSSSIKEILVNPIIALPNSSTLYFLKNDPTNGNIASIMMENGPTFFLLENTTAPPTNSTPALAIFRGKHNFIPTSSSSYYIMSKEYKTSFIQDTMERDSGTFYTKSVKFIEGTQTIYDIINHRQTDEFDAVITAPLPPGVTSIPGTVIPTKFILDLDLTTVTSFDFTQTILVQNGSAFNLIKFNRVTPVKQNQEYYYGGSETYSNVLPDPGLGYSYFSDSGYTTPIALSAAIPTATSGPITVYFKYAEINGQILLVNFQGITKVPKIYLTRTFNNIQNIKLRDLNNNYVFSNSITSYTVDQYSITLVSNVLTVTKTTKNSVVPEIFIKTTSGQIELYTFNNVDVPPVGDIFVYDSVNWTAPSNYPPFEIDTSVGASVNPTIAFPTVSTSDTSSDPDIVSPLVKVGFLKVNTSSSSVIPGGTPNETYNEIYGTSAYFPFKVYFIGSDHNKIQLIKGFTNVFTNVQNIDKFGSDIKSLKTYTGEELFTTTHISANIKSDQVKFQGLSIGTAKIFIIYGNDGNTPDNEKCEVFEIDVIEQPLKGIIELEVIEDTTNAIPVYSLPSIIGIYSIKSSTDLPVLPATQFPLNTIIFEEINDSNTVITLSNGDNKIAYSIDGIPSTAPYPIFTLRTKIISKPATFDMNRTLKIGSQSIKFEVIKEIFGTSTGNSIVSIKDNTSVLSGTINTPTGPAIMLGNSQGLTITPTAQTGSDIIIDASGKFFTLSVKDIGQSNQEYEFEISMEVTTVSLNLLKTVVQTTIKIFVWSPDTSQRRYIVAKPDNNQYAYFYGQVPVTAPPSSNTLDIEGEFEKIEYNGQLLTGTRHNAIDWSDKNEIYVKSKTQVVDIYFLYTRIVSGSNQGQQRFYILSVILINNPQRKTFLVANTAESFGNPSSVPVNDPEYDLKTSTRTVDLLNEFFPTLSDKLIDAGVRLIQPQYLGRENIQSVPLKYSEASSAGSNFTRSIEIESGSSYQPNPSTIATATYEIKKIGLPQLLTDEIEFVVPYGESFEIKSTMVSPGAIIQLDYLPETLSSDISVDQKTGSESVFVYGKKPTNGPSTSSFNFGIKLVKDYMTYPIDGNIVGNANNYIDNPIDDPGKTFYKVAILFYDPDTTNTITKITYFDSYHYDFIGLEAKSIIYDTVTYIPNSNNIISTNFITVQNLPNTVTNPNDTVVRVRINKSSTLNHFVVVFRMTNGTLSILDVRFVTPMAITQKFYVVENQNQALTNYRVITLNEISNFSTQIDNSIASTTPPATAFTFDGNFSDNGQVNLLMKVNVADNPYVRLPGSSNNTAGNSYYEFLSPAGLPVGKIAIADVLGTSSNTQAITVIGSANPGKWQNFQILIEAEEHKALNTDSNQQTTLQETRMLIINVELETIENIAIVPRDITVAVGENLNFNMQDFVLKGLGHVVFSNWIFDGSPVLPIGFTSDGTTLKTTSPFTTVANYNLEVTATSTQIPNPTIINFKIIVYDPSSQNVQNREVTLVKLDPFFLSLGTSGESIVSINDIPIKIMTINSVKLTPVITPSLGIQMQANTTFTNEFNFTVLTKVNNPIINQIPNTFYYIKVRQIDDEKNINLNSFEYTGSIFKNSNQQVSNYTTSDNLSVQKLPGTRYSLPNSGNILINLNGTYEILSTNQMTVSITTNLGKTMTITHSGSDRVVKNVVLSPPSEYVLGKNPILIKINQQTLESVLDLPYATFSLSDNKLRVSEVKTTFEPTIVQVENLLEDKIEISAFVLDINRNPNSQIIFKVPKNSTLRNVFNFVPNQITYNSMDLIPGSSIDFFKQGDDTLLGSYIVSGNSITITSRDETGFSLPIGLYDDNMKSYFYIIVEVSSTITSNPIFGLPNDNITSPDNSDYILIGLLDGSEIVTQEGVSLSQRAQILQGKIFIETASISGDFTFYGVSALGLVTIIKIKYIHDTIVVKDITKILAASFLRGEPGPLQFTDSSLTVTGEIVNNPNSLNVITTLRPFNGRFTIEQI